MNRYEICQITALTLDQMEFSEVEETIKVDYGNACISAVRCPVSQAELSNWNREGLKMYGLSRHNKDASCVIIAYDGSIVIYTELFDKKTIISKKLVTADVANASALKALLNAAYCNMIPCAVAA